MLGRPRTSSPEKRRADARARGVKFRHKQRLIHLITLDVAAAYACPGNIQTASMRTLLPEVLSYVTGKGEDLACYVEAKKADGTEISKNSRYSEVAKFYDEGWSIVVLR